ncbi:MAG: sensor histidine kinase [Actinomycetota bacterium]|nr:sensor histidine kinase [Actinomycetota bacterium]
MTWPTSPATGLVHEGFLYAGVADYLAGTVPFVLDGLAAGEAVAVAVPGANLARIADALGSHAPAVHLVDMAEAGRNPGRIIGSVLTRFIDEHPGQRARIIGEPLWAERSHTEYPACVQHEALVNVAFAEREATILCPYDAGRLGSVALLDATRTHPILVDGEHHVASLQYVNPVQLAARYDTPLPEPPESADVDVMVFDAAIGARGVRRFVHEHAENVGMIPGRIADLRAAVHEVALNTLVHTGQPGILSVWLEDGHLVCEVQDSGSITDPLVGRRPPEPFDGCSGLFLVHQLCDLVRTHVTGHGLTIRMYVRVARP